MTDPEQSRRLLNQYKVLRDQIHGTYIGAVTRDRPYYELTFADKLVPPEWRKKGIQPVVPPTARNAVDNAADHILTSPDWRVPTRPTVANHREEALLADRKAAFLRFVFEDFEVESGDPLSQLVKSVIKDGKGVIKTLIRWDRVPDTVDQTPVGMQGVPWEWTYVPPETVLEDPDNPDDPGYVYEAYETRVGTAIMTFPDALGQWRERVDTDKVEVIEYWSRPRGDHRGMHLVWVEGMLALDEENPYFWETPDGGWDGYVPYLICSSGWGERTADGDMAKYYVGILRYMHSILDAEASHQTDGSAQLKMSTFPPIIGKGIPEGMRLNVGLGRITRLPDPTMDVQFMRWPELPVSLFQLISRVTEQANELSKFGTLGGTPLRGVDTATEADSTLRNAAAKLTRPVNGIRALLRRGAKRLMLDVEKVIEQPVAVFGATTRQGGVQILDPSDIEGFYMVGVELQTTDRQALDRIGARMWADLYQIFPDLSAETAMENAGIEDWTGEQQRAAKERVFRAPPMEQLRILLALAAQGKMADTVRQAFQQQIQGGNDPLTEAAAGAEGGQPNPVNAAREQQGEAPGEFITRNAQQEAQVTQSDRENA